MWNDIRNNTSFVTEAKEYFKTINKSDTGLRYHQEVILHYFMKYPVRGLLIFHKMGFGKSLLAAAVTHFLIEQGMEPIFISAKTLHSNFSETMQKYEQLTGKKAEDNISYVALNASNMIDQFARSTMSDIEISLDKKKIFQGKLDNKLIVIDEAHNLFNSIANGSANATQLYKSIMKSKCRLLFLTGSPIVNDPFEIALCFNMLAGEPIFGEDYKEFTQYFNTGELIRNENKFANRINGMVSFYDQTAENVSSGSGFSFPEQRETIVCEVPMSKYQSNLYMAARKIELENTTKRKFKTQSLQKPKVNSNYRVATRQICNFAYPDYALEVTKTDGKIKTKNNLEKLDIKDVIAKLDVYSPKYKKLIENVMREQGIGLIYSQFLGYGLKILEMLLIYHKVSYAIISGEVPKEEVDKIIKIINSKENCNGELIKAVLISATATEGVDFRNIRHIHLEPFWHAAREKQIIARGVRANSHIDLPEKQRYVQPYVYLSKFANSEEQTTDQYLYYKSKKNSQLIDSFYNIMKLSAVDCPVHYKTCRVCAPTNRKLFTEDLQIDITKPDSCAGETKAKIYVLDGKKFALYQENGEPKFAEQIGDKWVPVSGDLEQLLHKKFL